MVVVVGTSHTIQRLDTNLLPYLGGLCEQFNICAIAEEMSEEALAQYGGAATIPMQVAGASRLPHRFCDPTMAQRAELGIRQEGAIRLEAALAKLKLSEPEFEKLIGESHEMRERYWLDQLHKLNVWPVLFVCGADHVLSFCELLNEQHIAVHLAANDWGA